MSEVGWLIERADAQNPGCVMPNSFLGFRGTYRGYAAGTVGCFDWVESAQWAIRFARKEDAEKFIAAFENFQEHRVHSLTIPGLRTGDPRAVAVEHSWELERSEP